jgi:hypothetical protein
MMPDSPDLSCGSRNHPKNEYIHSFTACVPIRKLSNTVVVGRDFIHTARAHLRQYFAR